MPGIATLSQLQALLRSQSVRTAYVKLLSPKQDNEKNRIHLGSGLDGVTNLFPAQIEVRSASESLTERNSAAGKTKLDAQIDFAWLGGNGARYDAPSTRIIDYLQYPEVRMSGYLVVASGRAFTLSHGLHPLVIAAIGQLVERFSGPVIDRGETGPSLPAPDRDIDVERVKVRAVAYAPGAFGGDERSPRPQEAINHVVTMLGAVEDSVRDHFHSFGRGVELEHVTFPFAPARGRARIVPDV